MQRLREELRQLHDKPADFTPPEIKARELEAQTAAEEKAKVRKKAIMVVDLNKLIEQLSARGFTLTYNCSHCGAPLRIDGKTKVDTVKVCPNCGSGIEAIDLAKFIESYLS